MLLILAVWVKAIFSLTECNSCCQKFEKIESLFHNITEPLGWTWERLGIQGTFKSNLGKTTKKSEWGSRGEIGCHLDPNPVSAIWAAYFNYNWLSCHVFGNILYCLLSIYDIYGCTVYNVKWISLQIPMEIRDEKTTNRKLTWMKYGLNAPYSWTT